MFLFDVCTVSVYILTDLFVKTEIWFGETVRHQVLRCNHKLSILTTGDDLVLCCRLWTSRSSVVSKYVCDGDDSSAEISTFTK